MSLIFFSAWLFGCGGLGNSPKPPAASPQTTLVSSVPSINPGQPATLTWTSANATSVSISPSVGTPPLPLNGSVTVTPALTTIYTITATGASGTTPATATVTITVGSTPPPKTPPTVTLVASPTQVNSGQPSSLAWTSANATSVNIVPNVLNDELPSYPLNGSANIIPLTTTTYTITATGPGGTASATATVNVTQVPPTVNLTLLPTSILAGKPSTLSWTTVNAATLTIVDTAGHPVTVKSPQQGSCVINGTPQCATPPPATTTYTATATSPAGLTATARATLTVSNLSVTLTAHPASIRVGGASTLTFTSMNAVSLSIDHNVGIVNPPSGTVSVSPQVTTVYTITATDAGGIQATATATVAVDNGLQTLQHIIFFIQENRSFDNYFGKLGVYRSTDPTCPGCKVSDIDGIADDTTVSIPDPHGTPVHPFHSQTVCIDNLSPSWDESHADVDLHNGAYKMDGFVRVAAATGGANDPLGHRAMGYYNQTDLPYYYELATQYATSDRWFAPELANTIPNRMYLFTATSYGTTYPEVPYQNPLSTPPNQTDYNQPTIFDALDKAGVEWRYYYQDNSTFLSQFDTWNNMADRGKVRNISEYYDILSGNIHPGEDPTLAPVVFIERGSGSAGTDEHPDAGKSIQTGAAAAANIINAFIASKYYATGAFILSYDEPGGLYDHVAPAVATPPDSLAPSLQPPPDGTPVTPGDFKSTGMRLPFILVSPYVKAHYVSHTPMDNTAILKFIEDRFAPGTNLTARDGAQSPMLEFFDFSNPSLLIPPPLPTQPTNGTCNPTLETH
ncbi:MAG: alkaline phosphatase family protein [Acidobacteriaceae bacterium]